VALAHGVGALWRKIVSYRNDNLCDRTACASLFAVVALIALPWTATSQGQDADQVARELSNPTNLVFSLTSFLDVTRFSLGRARPARL
jgi:hypothetical protein